jgi:hypothetical protein
MANNIKKSADGLALQVTKDARAAGLVEEDTNGDATRLAGVYVYGFDNLLLVIDAERVTAADRAGLVASAARDTGSIHRGAASTIATAGNGYQVQLPGCKAAGFDVDDRAPVVPTSGVLVIHDGHQRRLADDLVAICEEQRTAGTQGAAADD